MDVDEDLVAEQLVGLVHDTRCTNCLIWCVRGRMGAGGEGGFFGEGRGGWGGEGVKGEVE